MSILEGERDHDTRKHRSKVISDSDKGDEGKKDPGILRGWGGCLTAIKGLPMMRRRCSQEITWRRARRQRGNQSEDQRCSEGVPCTQEVRRPVRPQGARGIWR